MDRRECMDALNKRFDILEELMKMLIINNVLDEKLSEKIKAGISDELEEKLAKIGIIKYKANIIDELHVIFVYIEDKIKISRIREIKYDFEDLIDGFIPVFVFDKLNGNRRKKFEEERISYYINGKEMHVF